MEEKQSKCKRNVNETKRDEGKQVKRKHRSQQQKVRQQQQDNRKNGKANTSMNAKNSRDVSHSSGANNRKDINKYQEKKECQQQ